MKFLCLAYEEERALNELSTSEWQALRQETLERRQPAAERSLDPRASPSKRDHCIDDPPPQWQGVGQ